MNSRKRCALPSDTKPGRLIIGYRILYCLLLLIFFSGSKLYSQCNATIGSNVDPIEGCEVLTVQFNDLSTGAVSRSWDFGDGAPASMAQNPVHSYNAGSRDTTYTLKLSITCSSDSTSTAVKTVTVYARPETDFVSDRNSLCAITDSIHLSNSSSSDDKAAHNQDEK